MKNVLQHLRGEMHRRAEVGGAPSVRWRADKTSAPRRRAENCLSPPPLIFGSAHIPGTASIIVLSVQVVGVLSSKPDAATMANEFVADLKEVMHDSGNYSRWCKGRSGRFGLSCFEKRIHSQPSNRIVLKN